MSSFESTSDAPPDAFFGDLCTGLSENDCVLVYTLSLYALLFMILPVMIPVTIAAYSIVGEKTTVTSPLLEISYHNSCWRTNIMLNLFGLNLFFS
jgi:hypothetical protein